MKKALSVVLAMLMVFSMVGVMAFAEGETDTSNLVTYKFLNDDGTVYSVFQVAAGVENFDMTECIPEEPTKADTETTRYIFKHWILVENPEDTEGVVYYRGTIEAPTADMAGQELLFKAVYSTEDISARQSFWNFIESLFERINLLFEYFALVFQW